MMLVDSDVVMIVDVLYHEAKTVDNEVSSETQAAISDSTEGWYNHHLRAMRCMDDVRSVIARVDK